MGEKMKTAAIFLVVFAAILILGSCGGGAAEKTWFNLPSLPLKLQEDGTATVYGVSIGQILSPAQMQQLQAAGTQKVEARIGKTGVHILLNGEPGPYLAWDDESTAQLQEVLRTMPNLPNGGQIASALPWLRRVGLGASLYMPGVKRGDVPRFSGTPHVAVGEAPAEPTIGPITVGALAFDPEGNATIQGIPAADLAGLGIPPIKLDSATMGLLSSLGVEKLVIDTEPNGLKLTLNDQPLPHIAYDSQTLDTLMNTARGFIADPQTLALVESLVPQLPGADVNLTVSFTGEPLAETSIGNLNLKVGDDGNLSVFGLPVTSEPVLQPDVLAKLQAADVQHLSVDIGQDGLVLAANGQALPAVSWTPESMQTLAGIVGPLAGMDAETINTALDLVAKTPIQANVALPGASGEPPTEINTTMQPADLGGMAPPVVRLNLTYDKSGQPVAVGDLSAADLSALGVALPALPAALTALGADEIQLKTEANKLNVLIDGETALSINYDEPSLKAAIALAGPFLGEDSPLSNPGVQSLLNEVILPMAPAADVDVRIQFE